MSRPVIPQDVKNLRGDHRMPASGLVPECPEWIEGDARKEWERVVPLLAAQRCLSDADAMTLAAYCEAYSHFKECSMRVRQEGMTVHGRLHPLARHVILLLAEIRRLAGEFGFSPAARTKIDVPAEQDEDFADFMKGTSHG